MRRFAQLIQIARFSKVIGIEAPINELNVECKLFCVRSSLHQDVPVVTEWGQSLSGSTGDQAPGVMSTRYDGCTCCFDTTGPCALPQWTDFYILAALIVPVSCHQKLLIAARTSLSAADHQGLTALHCAGTHWAGGSSGSAAAAVE